MHERNPYKSGIDFTALAHVYPALKEFLISTSKGTSTIDFKNTSAQRSLTEALLARDYGLKLSLPENRLCPPVPNRLNYILWIQDLLIASFQASPGLQSDIIGLDIGTGASVIYPLLACALEPMWKFFGTEIDEISYNFASLNISQNDLAERIFLVKTSRSERIMEPLFDPSLPRFAFTMCNPPFYGSTAEIEQSAEEKHFEPNAVCTGAETEMITPGGEVAFVRQMVEESLQVSSRSLWFTSMLGKLASVKDIVDLLRAHKIDNYALTELVQGQTRRWVVAWSFFDARLPDGIARNLPGAHHILFPASNCLRQVYSIPCTSTEYKEIVLSVLRSVDDLQIESDVNAGDVEGHTIRLRVSALTNTWSRAARRKGKQAQIMYSDKLMREAPSTHPILSALVQEVDTARDSLISDFGERTKTLECIWLRGKERALFEGFWGYTSRKIASALQARREEAILT